MLVVNTTGKCLSFPVLSGKAWYILVDLIIFGFVIE